MKETSKLREQSVAELQSQCDELNVGIFELRCENSMQRKLGKPHLLKEKKRQRARILTILREKAKE